MGTTPVFLEGAKTILRPLEQSDLKLCQRWINDPEVRRFVSHTFPATIEDEEEWYESVRESNSSVTLGIVEKTGGELIGTMGIDGINWISRTASTGAIIGEKDYWGRGFGTDAKMVLLKYAFLTLNLRKICSRVIEYNERSLGYLKKCGYKIEGRRKDQMFKEGEYRDVVLVAVRREEWLSLWKEYKKEHEF